MIAFADANKPITISTKGRRQTIEILRAQVLLIRGVYLSHRRSIQRNLELWLEAARMGREAGHCTHVVHDLGHTAEVQEYFAGAQVGGRLQIRREADRTGAGALVPIFGEVFPEDKPPKQAIDWLRQLPFTSRELWEATLARYRQPAFFITGIEEREALLIIRKAIEDSLKKGWTLKQYEEEIRRQLSDLALTGGRLRNVWHNNVTNAFNRGRYEEIQVPEVKAVLPYYLFDAIVDAVVRPNHAALEGGIAPVDWPGWQKYRPMLGFNCRCSVIAITAGRAQRLIESGQGWDLTEEVPADAGPDEGYIRMN